MFKKSFKNLIGQILKKLDQFNLSGIPFVIISNNCWGSEIYKDLNRSYNTPFIGLFIHGPCYIKLLENFDYYMSQGLQFTKKSSYVIAEPSYPIGFLEDVEIHFLHYKNERDAWEKWERRKKRMLSITNKDNYFFKICDRDYTDLKIIERFHQLNFLNKISFAIDDFPNLSHITVKEQENSISVKQGLILYRTTNHYLDISEWIKTGRIRKTLLSRIKVFTKYP